MLIINPGSGPIKEGSAKQAEANMAAFQADVNSKMSTGSLNDWELAPDLNDIGRYGFRCTTGDGRTLEVLMPGLPLDRVRYLDRDDQDIWDFPRLYVEGSSWVWMYAVTEFDLPVEDEEI